MNGRAHCGVSITVPGNDYHFITRWRVAGTAEEVSTVIGDPTELPRWWPSVYLAVDELAPGDASGTGRRIALYTRGWLPYTLRWDFEVTRADGPGGLELVASGDFVGRGIWSFEQEGDEVFVTYDWKLRAEKPLLKRLSGVLRPVFSANHRWAMARGEESLRLELRRRTGEPSVPAPPGTSRSGTLMLGALGGIVAFAALSRLRR